MGQSGAATNENTHVSPLVRTRIIKQMSKRARLTIAFILSLAGGANADPQDTAAREKYLATL
jgi:hypothetical protein